MVRERVHFTVKNLAAWNEAQDLIQEINEIQISANRTTATVWTQVVGPFNEIVIESEYPDLAAYERETLALMSDPAALKIFVRFEQITVADKGYNELFMTADKART